MNEPPYLEAVVRMTVFDHAPAHVKAIAREEGDEGALMRWWSSLSVMHQIDILAAADRRSAEALRAIEGEIERLELAMAEPKREHVLQSFFSVFR